MESHLQDKTPQPSSTPTELAKLRFDYAWKWFNFHADQRTKMFNFMLIVFGIFATAVVSAIEKGMAELAVFICGVAVLLAFVFWLLDSRNRDLLWMGEDVLVELEKKSIFGEGVKIYGHRNNREIDFGILWRQAQEEKRAGKSIMRDAWLGKHRVWMPLFALIMGTLFVVAGIYAWSKANELPFRVLSTTISNDCLMARDCCDNPSYTYDANQPRYRQGSPLS